MDDARGTYGYRQRTPVVLDDNYADNRPSGQTVGGLGTNHHAVGWNNPLFWWVAIALVVLGYIGFAFNTNVKVGKK